MKVHFPKFFQLLKGLFFLFVTIGFLKKIGFDFEIDLSLYFEVFLIYLILFIGLESVKNKRVLVILSKKTFLSIKEFYKKETLKNQKLIISFLSSRFYGKYQTVNVFWVKILSPIILISLPFRNIYSRFFLLFSIFLIFFQKSFSFDIYPLNFEIRFYFLIAFWLLIIVCLKLKPEISLINSIILLSICPYFLIGDRDLITAEKICLWAFVFLLIGIIHNFYVFVFKQKDYRKLKYV